MKRITLAIEDTALGNTEKFDSVVTMLRKAFEVPDIQKKSTEREEYRYLSMRQLEAKYKDAMRDRLTRLLNDFMQKAVAKAIGDDVPFTLGGKIHINPSTGKPLTRKEWGTLKASLSKFFGRVFEDTDDQMVKESMALGKILQEMDEGEKEGRALSSIDLVTPGNDQAFQDLYGFTDTDMYSLEWARQRAGEYIVELEDKTRRKIQETIIEAQQNRWGSRRLQSQLYDEFGRLNRDWTRIAETELAYNFNNGWMQAEAGTRRPGEMILVEGSTAANACPYCIANIMGKVFVLLDQPPATGDDQAEADGKSYRAVWAGKNNVGRSRAEWWPCVPAHPHCKCTLMRHVEVEAKYLEMAGLT